MQISTRYFSVIAVAILMGTGCSQKPPSDESAPAENLAAPFVGKWKIAMPQEDGVIVNVPRVSCDDPVVITADGPDALVRTSPKGDPLALDLSGFNGRITWMPADMSSPYSFIAEIKSPDTFWVYTANLGKADWDNPLEYKRCS